jgi:fatty-acyl-CoA synthase
MVEPRSDLMATGSRFRDLLDSHPERPAFFVGESAASRAELAQAADRAAALFGQLGLGRGDIVALWLPDGGAWLQFFFAAADCGILAIPISTRYRAAEARHVLELSGASAVVAVEEFLGVRYSDIARDLQAELPGLRHIITVTDTNLFHAGATGPVARLGTGSDLFCTFSTSGTTGRPKLAVHDQTGCAHHALTVAKLFGLGPQDVMLCVLPLYGVLGFVQAFAAIAAGAACVFMPLYKADEAAAAVARHRVTFAFGSDAMFDAILKVPGADLSSWRGGGLADFNGLTDGVVTGAERDWNLPLVGIYGSSECFALMATRLPSEPLPQRGLAGGRPVSADITFRIVDVENGQPIEPGKTSAPMTGALQIRGPNVMRGYLNNPAATAAAFTEDGWFRTGDLAYADGDAFVYLSRLGDALRLRGYLVDPTEIELFLCRHPAVTAAQVVGVRLPSEGDVAVAFVQAGSPVEEAALIAYCRQGIANYKVPRRVAIVPDFPYVHGPNGSKIQKSRLRDEAAQILAAQPPPS